MTVYIFLVRLCILQPLYGGYNDTRIQWFPCFRYFRYDHEYYDYYMTDGYNDSFLLYISDTTTNITIITWQMDTMIPFFYIFQIRLRILRLLHGRWIQWFPSFIYFRYDYEYYDYYMADGYNDSLLLYISDTTTNITIITWQMDTMIPFFYIFQIRLRILRLLHDRWIQWFPSFIYFRYDYEYYDYYMADGYNDSLLLYISDTTTNITIITWQMDTMIPFFYIFQIRLRILRLLHGRWIQWFPSFIYFRYDYEYYMTDGYSNSTMEEYQYPEQRIVIKLCQEIARNESLTSISKQICFKTQGPLKAPGNMPNIFFRKIPQVFWGNIGQNPPCYFCQGGQNPLQAFDRVYKIPHVIFVKVVKIRYTGFPTWTKSSTSFCQFAQHSRQRSLSHRKRNLVNYINLLIMTNLNDIKIYKIHFDLYCLANLFVTVFHNSLVSAFQCEISANCITFWMIRGCQFSIFKTC